MKALETPEEKRARRLAKKEAKERKKREKMGWSEEYMGYTNADNPFGDNNLLGSFKWQKVRGMFVLESRGQICVDIAVMFDGKFCLGFDLLCVCVFLRLCRRRASATCQKKI